ncbi:cupin domain-containing protein [Pseudodesulfovibrio indicus]|uniref:cupin domain-containing protein n=1 Tax=Pseudodesulfovibrio indicus TaxID=1716143 RepID=UPI00292DA458|nr:cupin domain-containing protein [Pseudodesulfovibrio indicus]
MNEQNVLGHHIRQLRKAQGMTLRDLAEKAGCSESMLSKIENGKGNPSIKALQGISKALGTNMGALFQPDATPGIVSHWGERHMAQMTTGRGVVLEYLSPHLPGHTLQAHIHVVEPGGSSLGEISHEGEEVGYVLTGELELTVDDQTYHVKEGDSFFFSSELPHAFRNNGAVTARVLWVNTPPTY